MASVVYRDLHNGTDIGIMMMEGNAGIYRSLTTIRPGEKYRFMWDLNQTYREHFWCGEGGTHRIIFSVDDFNDWKSIAFVRRGDEITWEGIPPRTDDPFLRTAWENGSRKFEAVASFSVELEKDLKRVVIHRAQSANLVQFCSERVQKIREIFSLVSEFQKWRLYKSRKLPQLANSLDNLLRALLSAQKLLKGCGQKEWRRAALVLSKPPPDPQNLDKYSGSKFFLVIRELGWSFDMVQYALGEVGTKGFKWDSRRDRYVLRGNEPEVGVANDGMELLEGDRDRETFDRHALLTDLENGSISKKNFFMSLAGWVWYNSSHGSFAADIEKRCHKADIAIIDYPDLEGKKLIAWGGSKTVYKAKWLGLEVAVAAVRDTLSEDLKTEAGVMDKVRHPNVVDFFGCAFRNEEDVATQADPWTTCLIMELMEEDLGYLIKRIMEDPGRQSFGGPFSLSVTVDILMQIVEAMIHSHKHQVMHRDLKPGNCLVSKKLAPRSDVNSYYTVKVTDFGISKSWDSIKKHTEQRGTVRYMAFEAWERGDYTHSVDIYGFGMVCYEVVTGYPPFKSCIKHKDLIDLLRKGERPPIPGTCPESLSILMKKCWAGTPDVRPSFKAIRKELWDLRLLIEAPL